jgi:alpha-2-macroglobulin
MEDVMARWWPVLAFALALIIASPDARAEFNPPGLGADADGYSESLTSKTPPQPQAAVRDAALAEGAAALAAKDGPKAVAALEKAVIQGASEPKVWMELSDAWMLGAKSNRARALQAAFIAFRSTEEELDKAAPLWRLATLFADAFDRPDLALDALKEMKAIDENTGKTTVAAGYPTLPDRMATLRQTVGLTVRNVRIETNAAAPRVCYAFADALSGKRGVKFEDFVKIEPPVTLAADPRDEELCLSGVTFGQTYKITLRQGLPGVDGLAMRKDETRDIRVGNRPPTLSFRGSGFILPRESGGGIPLTVVNVPRVGLSVYRVNDRNLVPAMRGDTFLQPLAEYEADDLETTNGEKVWTGEMTVPEAPANAEATLALPFKEIVPKPDPGFYVVVAEPRDVASRDAPFKRATQWVLVSDIGLTAMEGRDGIAVFARSIDTAKPLAGVEVALVARNNAELARVKTDEQGRARFPEGLARGTGGRQPVAAMAYLGADYALLSLTRAAFDLSDRGVGGRATPGPMDAFGYTDRGVYRQNETVHVAVLVRDDKTEAVGGLPLTVTVRRPTGTVYRTDVVTTSAAGGATLTLPLSATAPLGGWIVEFRADPKADPIGTAEFQVDDFVPERLAVELSSPAPWIEPGKPAEILAKVRFLYGPPAAGLDGEAEVLLKADDQPFPAFKDYRFGLIQERIDGRLDKLTFPATDAAGESRIAVKLPPQPDTTRPLKASVYVTASEPGGRPTRQTIDVPVRTQAYAIGIKPRFADDRIAEGQAAGFDVIAVAPDGKTIAKPGLAWELVEEVRTYTWYFTNGRYAYRVTSRDRSIATGTLAAGDKPVGIDTAALPWGRYRFEIADKATGVASSMRFAAGWQPADDGADTPDTLEIVADKPSYKPGETAKLRITPPFAGEALLTIAGDRLHDSRTFSVPAEGTTVEVPVDAAWGPGAYVTATVYRPPVKGKERQPVRAIGLAWVGVDPGARSYTVGIEAPDLARPRGSVDVTLRLTGEGAAEPAFVTLAAVDEGILQLTGFETPDPVGHFLGKRRLGVDIRDDYGYLIDPLDSNWGKLRQGGDGGGAGLPVVPFTVVSLFHGPVEIGPDGTAKIRIDIPDFTGELRLMAVAYSKTRVGSAAKPMTVREPLVADAALPRFLAPGDVSQVTVNLHNVEGKAGDFAVAIKAESPLAVDGGAQTVALAAGERKTLTFPLRGLVPGIGKVMVDASGPGGVSVHHEHGLTVRPVWAVESKVVSQRLAPGGTSTFGAPLLASYVPGTASATMTFGTAPPFDVAGVLKALDRYPYGCLEQTVSRALPLLSVRFVENVIGKPKADEGLETRIQKAVAATLDRQRYDGSFSLWGGQEESDAWLTGYAMEFLARAKAKGYPVFDGPFGEGLDWLRRHAIDGGTGNEALASRAYALHALALAGVATPAPARYFADAFLDKLPTPLAKGQVGAALARLGDKNRAQRAFTAALKTLARNDWQADYGSTLRDAAALAVLIAESGLTIDPAPVLAALPAADATAARTNTQEQAWLVLAAEALTKAGAVPKLTLGGKPLAGGDPVALTPTVAELGGGVTVANAGAESLWQTVSVAGVTAEPPPAAKEGMKIKRFFFNRKGEALNLETIAQNDVFVLVIEGEATTKLFHRAAVTHLLPAGWEVEDANPAGGEGTAMPWLTDLSATVAQNGRDDRVMAAADLDTEKATFKVAFLLRAVTPGTYALPGARVEDMYRPAYFARQPVGKIVVLPAK